MKKSLAIILILVALSVSTLSVSALAENQGAEIIEIIGEKEEQEEKFKDLYLEWGYGIEAQKAFNSEIITLGYYDPWEKPAIRSMGIEYWGSVFVMAIDGSRYTEDLILDGIEEIHLYPNAVHVVQLFGKYRDSGEEVPQVVITIITDSSEYGE